MKYFIPVLFFLIGVASSVQAQRVNNFVMMDANGVTGDPKKAVTHLIEIEHPDGHYEKLDYKAKGPMRSTYSYTDATMKVLDGKVCEYFPNGFIKNYGNYLANEKHGFFMTYNDTGKCLTMERYENNVLKQTYDPDVEDTTKYEGDKEADFPGGMKAWRKYLVKKMTDNDAANKVKMSGNVYINFAIKTDGEVVEVYVSRSVVFGLDQDALSVIRASPAWKPEYKKGTLVKAYRRQPITYLYE